MKKIQTMVVACAISSSFLTYAQVGIGTQNPQTTFHIDGSKDNPATGVPSAAQQDNDFSVTSTAKVGIGTTSPSEKLDVASGNARIRNINLYSIIVIFMGSYMDTSTFRCKFNSVRN